jgi:Secretion system C-terminal sorting domain
MKQTICALLIGVLICASTSLLHAQSKLGHTKLIGGYGYQVNFSTSPITHLPVTFNNQTYFASGHSNICDTNGNLYLVSDGMNLYNKQRVLIEDGDTLVPSAFAKENLNFSGYSQSSIILPFDSGMYYLVTPALSDTAWDNFLNNLTHYGYFDLLLYDVIDMKRNNGAGKVTQRMVPLVQSARLAKTQMMACRHANGKDWWLLKMAQDSNNIYTFLFKQDTVINYGIQRSGLLKTNRFDLEGQMMFDPTGTKMVSTYDLVHGNIMFADFDRCTGRLSHYSNIYVPPVNSTKGPDSTLDGVCFSPNGRFLYATKFTHIMQYDLWDSTWYDVHGEDTTTAAFTGYTTIYPAADGKLYISNFHGIAKQLSVVDAPNNKGAACSFCRKCMRSNTATGYLDCMPCMPDYGLGKDVKPCYPQSSETLVKLNEGFMVYPNPASTRLEVSGATRGSKKDLYDSMGKLMYSTTTNEIDVSHLSKGMYYLRVGNMSKKVVVE